LVSEPSLVARPLTRAQALQNRAFLKELRRTGNVRLSARAVGAKYGTMARTDEELDVIETEYRGMSLPTLAWINENMGIAARAKYGGGIPDPIQFRWGGEHSPEHQRKRLGMMQRTLMKIKNINELLQSDQWDDRVPLRKRKRTKEWKLLKAEMDKMQENG
jgi:hypothetical protein